MKYAVLLCDGMSDLGENTPMKLAKKPVMDRLCRVSEVGLSRTVPDNLSPGSDVANLAVLGYNPDECYTGRSPLEAASIGIDMKPDDISLRCNLVTLSDSERFCDCSMLDYCAGDIHTEEASEIISFIEKELGSETFAFYSGVSYRHCLIWRGGPDLGSLGKLTPPHDITGKPIAEYLNADSRIISLMEKSYELLRNRGSKANSIWLWGEGKRANLPSFKGKYGLNAAMISAVDLLKGIGKLSGMEVIEVPGATGYIDTNFAGKAEAAVSALKRGADLAYIHIEAPDECGHRGEAENKVRAIELIDELVLSPVLDALEKSGERFRILICPDHPTPLPLKTHTRDPVPFMIYDSLKGGKRGNASAFNEENAAKTGILLERGYELMGRFVNGG